MTVRLALETVLPTHRQLRFFAGSHRLALDAESARAVSDDALATWPRLAACPLSPALHLRPGDATLHLSRTLRGYSVNREPTEPRGYVLTYVDADARYSGLPSLLTDGLALPAGAPLPDAAFPIAG